MTNKSWTDCDQDGAIETSHYSGQGPQDKRAQRGRRQIDTLTTEHTTSGYECYDDSNNRVHDSVHQHTVAQGPHDIVEV